MATKAEVLRQLERIPEDEPLFLLRGQDIVAPGAVQMWATVAKACGSPVEKINEANGLANEMEAWQAANPDRVKVPD